MKTTSTHSSTRLSGPLLLVLLGLGTSGVLSGCTEEAYCYSGCEELAAGAGRGSGGPSSGGGPGLDFDAGTGNSPLAGRGSLGSSGAAGADAQCDPAADDICDHRDNDCDGEIDEDADYSSVRSCGNCATDCTLLLANVASPTCTPPDDADGTEAGSCEFEECAQDFYDIDPDVPGCEYYCDDNPQGENTLDLGGERGCGRDDDCDGQIDEDVDTCDDTENCGRCGHRCVILHGTARCESSAEDGESCSEANTKCVVGSCEDGYHDANGNPSDGCEYQCDASGPEICNGIDDDCDGLIDNTDPDLEGAEGIGESCQGGTLGVCAAEAHAGIQKCIGGQLSCCDAASNDETSANPNVPETGLRNGICDSDEGAQVIRPGSQLELCNGLDDDCDGVADDAVTNATGNCGTNVGTCTGGTLLCTDDGQLLCQGAIGPSEETCNGADDDCDGVVDGSVIQPVRTCTTQDDCGPGELCAFQTTTSEQVCAAPTPEAALPCDVPPEVEGGVSACQAGLTACSAAGLVVCEGSVTRSASLTDTCGVDENCDGILNGTSLDLVTSCGSCDNDCTATSPNTDWSCVDSGDSYECSSNGCLANWHDLVPDDGDPCDTFCVSLGYELCNGQDDDCDGQVDEAVDITEPETATLRALCGVPNTNSPGCTPTVSCVAGEWSCSFADPDICGGALGDCSAPGLDEDCDGKDNNCNGVIDDEHSARKGSACTRSGASEGLDNDCVTQGRWICNAAGADLECDAPAPQASNEICDGKDNDCDGTIDETFIDTEAAALGNVAQPFVQPEVVALSATGPWVFAYEASRPDATENSQGTLNEPGTLACSGPGRLPWTNVAAREVEETCFDMGGRICRMSEWVGLCHGSDGTCDFGFTESCSTASDYTNPPYCNLAGFDGEPGLSGNQDALLPTESPLLAACASPWDTAFGNTTNAHDTTGNARELARCLKDRAVCPDAATCSAECCSGTSSSVSGPSGAQRLCGLLDNSQRLSGQPCSDSTQCCANDSNCTTSSGAACHSGICRNSGVADAATCVADGIRCTDADSNEVCDEYGLPCCDSAGPAGGSCGGAWTLPHAVYPLLGGSYRSDSAQDQGAICDYTFFKVSSDFRLFDSGFRCCFDEDPRL